MRKRVVLFCDSYLVEIIDSLSRKHDVVKIHTSNSAYLSEKSFNESYDIENYNVTGTYEYPDCIVFLFLFRRIIDVDRVQALSYYNIHFGILPEWRGNSCNVWALVNGSNEVGYSFHAVNNLIDGGQILWRHIQELERGQKYSEIRDFLVYHAIEKAPRLLESVNEPLEIRIEDYDIKYTPKSKLSDTIVTCKDVSATNFMGLFKAFGGSDWGFTLITSIGELEILSIWESSNVSAIYGFVGKVVNFIEYNGEKYTQVKVVDGYVYIGKVIYQGNIKEMKDLVNIGMQL